MNVYKVKAATREKMLKRGKGRLPKGVPTNAVQLFEGLAGMQHCTVSYREVGGLKREGRLSAQLSLNDFDVVAVK